MEDLRRLLLLRVLVVLGPCVMLLWLRFGLTPPQPLPFLAVALFLGWGALAFVAVHPFARRRKPVTAWELFAYLQLDVLALALLLFVAGTSLIGHPFWTMTGDSRDLNQVQFLKNLAIMGGLLLLSITGSGRFSVTRS